MDESRREGKMFYTEPKVLATYSKEELENIIKPHGSLDSYSGNDSGCGPIFN